MKAWTYEELTKAEGTTLQVDLKAFCNEPWVKRCTTQMPTTPYCFVGPEYGEQYKKNYYGYLSDTRHLALTFFENATIIVRPGNVVNADEAPDQKILGTFAASMRRVERTGWDPEIFAVDENDELLPAFRFLPDKSKAASYGCSASESVYPDVQTMRKAYHDGFQAEFSTYACSCHGYGFDELRLGLKTIQKAAQEHNPKAKLTLRNFFEVPPEMRFSATPEQVALGCMPSFNAYDTNPFQVADPFQFPFRMSGGHIHFALGRTSAASGAEIAKMMDFLVALPAVGMFAGIDDPRRRQFYGRAGEYRLPAYGIEYRTLSNAWLGHPAVGHVLMELARDATSRNLENFDFTALKLKSGTIRDIINECDVKKARKIVKEHSGIWDMLLCKHFYTNLKARTLFHQAVQKGVENIIPDYQNIAKNWKLDGRWASHSDNLNAGWGVFSTRFEPI